MLLQRFEAKVWETGAGHFPQDEVPHELDRGIRHAASGL